jgi:RNA ligase
MEIAKRYNYDKICVPGFVYLFEIIYPENRIVVNYGTDERLVLLSIINPEGKELDYDEIEMHGWDIVNRYDGIRDYSELKSKIPQDNEGFVVKFRNGFRMKIKGDEYVRLHRILTGFSNITIWEYLKDKRDFNEFLDRVPDEFDSWVRNTVEDIKNEYEMINSEYKWIFQVLMRSSQSETKKGFAELAKKYKHPSILFKMFDGKEYSDYIWKQIRPNYQKPFRKELEN